MRTASFSGLENLFEPYIITSIIVKTIVRSLIIVIINFVINNSIMLNENSYHQLNRPMSSYNEHEHATLNMPPLLLVSIPWLSDKCMHGEDYRLSRLSRLSRLIVLIVKMKRCQDHLPRSAKINVHQHISICNLCNLMQKSCLHEIDRHER